MAMTSSSTPGVDAARTTPLPFFLGGILVMSVSVGVGLLVAVG